MGPSARRRKRARLTATHLMQSVNRHRLALLTWLGVYPVLTLVALAAEPLLAEQPVFLRTLVMNAMMVPIMVYAVMPLIHRYLMPQHKRAP